MRVDEKICMAYFSHRVSRLYYSQLKEYTGLSHSSLQNALATLKAKELLREEKEKSNVFYSIKDKKVFALLFSQLAVQTFKELSIGVRVPLRNFLDELPRQIFSVVLFGSASRKQERVGSDIDLLLVSHTECNVDEIHKRISAVSKYPLNIFQCSTDQFFKNTDHIIIQARTTGFPIYGEQNFYEVVINEY